MGSGYTGCTQHYFCIRPSQRSSKKRRHFQGREKEMNYWIIKHDWQRNRSERKMYDVTTPLVLIILGIEGRIIRVSRAREGPGRSPPLCIRSGYVCECILVEALHYRSQKTNRQISRSAGEIGKGMLEIHQNVFGRLCYDNVFLTICRGPSIRRNDAIMASRHWTDVHGTEPLDRTGTLLRSTTPSMPIRTNNE